MRIAQNFCWKLVVLTLKAKLCCVGFFGASGLREKGQLCANYMDGSKQFHV